MQDRIRESRNQALNLALMYQRQRNPAGITNQVIDEDVVLKIAEKFHTFLVNPEPRNTSS